MRRLILCAVIVTMFVSCSQTEGSHFTGLGDLPGGTFSAAAFGISADGSVVVGQGRSASGTEAFRWTSDAGMVGLGGLPGGDFHSEAYDVSADGSVVVGFSMSTPGLLVEAFIWDGANGIRPLATVLTADFGLDLTGWTLRYAVAVSDDGRTIVGSGINPDGNHAAWVASLSPPPTSTATAMSTSLT